MNKTLPCTCIKKILKYLSKKKNQFKYNITTEPFPFKRTCCDKNYRDTCFLIAN